MISHSIQPSRRRSGLGTLLLVCALLLGSPALLEASYFRTGKVYFSHRNYERALEYFRRAVRARPGHGEAHFYMGYSLEKLGRKHEAVTSFRMAVRGRINRKLRVKAYWKIILYYKYRQDWTNVADYCRKLLRYRNIKAVQDMLEEAEKKQDPTTLETSRRLNAGEIAFGKRAYADAAGHFEAVLAVRSDHRRARWLLAQARMKLGDFESARTHLNELLRLNGRLWQYHYRVGICNFRTGRLSDAEKNFRTAEKLNQRAGDDFRYFVFMRLGNVYIEMGRMKAAREHYRSALKLRRRAAALGPLALAEYALGNRKAAMVYARAALRNRKAQRSKQLNPAAVITLGLAYAAGNRNKQAQRWLEQVPTSGAEWIPSYRSIAALTLGLVFSRLSNWEAARTRLATLDALDAASVDKLCKALGRDPARFKGRVRLAHGRALVELKRSVEAVTYLSKAPPGGEVSYQKARALAQQNDGPGAAAALQAAGSVNKVYWKRARSDPFFLELAQKDSTFAGALKNGGKTEPTEKPVPKKDPERPSPANPSPADQKRPRPKPS